METNFCLLFALILSASVNLASELHRVMLSLLVKAWFMQQDGKAGIHRSKDILRRAVFAH
jgi:hypothetical protein